MSSIELRIAALALASLLAALAIPSLRSVARGGLVAVAILALRPPWLGGPTTIAFVSGVSMEPTMHTGDLAVLVRQSDYRVGDIVAYHPSQSPDGMIVHRIVGGDRAQGFVVRGDNRSTDDYDRPTPAQLVGRAMVVLPSVGWFFAGLRVPALLGLIVALVAMWIAWDALFEPRKEEGLT